jgi:hypothetical protein
LPDLGRVRKDRSSCRESEDRWGSAPHEESYVTFRECIVYVVIPRLSKNKPEGSKIGAV